MAIKKTGGASKKSSAGSKSGSAVSKSSSEGSKKSSGGSKSSSRASEKERSAAVGNSSNLMKMLREFMTAEQLQGRSFERPTTRVVALEAPTRVDRVVYSRDEAVDEAQWRLLFAAGFRAELEPALPVGFFDRAFTAFDLVRSASTTAQNASAAVALEALKDALVTIREIVMHTAAVDDPARAALETDTVIEAKYSLVDKDELAERIIREAEKLRSRFPALTQEVIDDAKASLAVARAVVEENRVRTGAGKIARVLTADPKQRAIDVLVDSIDLLKAAAVATLRKRYRSAAQWLESPLEKRAKAKGEGEKKDEKGKEGEGEGEKKG